MLRGKTCGIATFHFHYRRKTPVSTQGKALGAIVFRCVIGSLPEHPQQKCYLKNFVIVYNKKLILNCIHHHYLS